MSESEDDDRRAEVQEALETTDQLHTDVSRLKRLGIMTLQESQVTQGQIDQISVSLTEKLPEE